MAWVPIDDSAVSYTLDVQGSPAAMESSRVVQRMQGEDWPSPTGFTLQFDEETRVRVTVEDYSERVDGLLITPAAFRWYDADSGPIYVMNETFDATAFTPAQFEGTVSRATVDNYYDFEFLSAQYGAGNGGDAVFSLLIEVWKGDPLVSYNCECDDEYPRTTLAALRKRVLRRLGFAAQANNPPPGMAELLDDFIRSAQELLFRKYSVFRRERFYTWDLVPGTRFYDLDANADTCTKKLDPRMISWAGISQGDGSWRPLYCGIDPVQYTARGPGIPTHYEIRQCIELWPAPVDDTWKLRIKGQFGLMPLEEDDDETTVDEEAIFLLALANAKAHYGQPDAGNYASQLTSYVRDLIRGGHHTRRYIPGTSDPRNAVRPVPVGGWPEDQA